MFDKSMEKVDFIEISNKGVTRCEGSFASLRLKFLETFKSDVLENLVKDKMLENHLIEIQLKAENRLAELVEYYKIKENIPNNLETTDPSRFKEIVDNLKKVAMKQLEEEILFI